MEGADSIRIVGNSLKNSNDGIYVNNLCSNIEIAQNRLINIQSDLSASDGTSGIFVQNSTKIDIINNFIQTSGNGPVIGINLLNTISCRTYYNSVNTTNTDAQGKSRGMYLKSSSEILARNNIFSIKNLGIPIHIDVDVNSFNLDYNNYYSPSGIIGKVNDEVFSNIAEWGQTVNGDANSMDYDNFCTGWEVHFSGQATVEDPYTITGYEWLFGDGESSHEQNAVHTFLTPGTYQVALRAYSSEGCYGEIITPVFIDPAFQGLRLDYNLVNETCRGDSTGSVELIATGGYPPYNYFVNGTQVAGNIITQFPSGKHEIRVEDSQNCSYNDSIESYPLVNMDPQIQANPLSGYAPLTPNGDGYNDFFEINTVGVKELNASIFNRWGNKMYEIDSVNGKWDGNTTGGAKAPDGTYFYAIVAKGLDDRNYERKGSVMLLRHGAETYPNPVENKVNIKIYDPLDAPVTISVYSVFGQLAHSEVLDNPENLVVDISHLSSGIYILKVNDGKQDYFARIIKN